MNPEIPPPFSPESFRSEGHKLVDQLSEYLSENHSAVKVINWLTSFQNILAMYSKRRISLSCHGVTPILWQKNSPLQMGDLMMSHLLISPGR
jgi:hypothetical protein